MLILSISEQSIHSVGIFLQLFISCIIINSNEQSTAFFCSVGKHSFRSIYPLSAFQFYYCKIAFKSVYNKFHICLLILVDYNGSKALSPLTELRSPLFLLCFSGMSNLLCDTFYQFLSYKQHNFGYYLQQVCPRLSLWVL